MSDLRRDFEGHGKSWGGMIISNQGSPVGYIPTEEEKREMDAAYEHYVRIKTLYSDLIRLETCPERTKVLKSCVESLEEDNK